jgi:hypothetical protein
VVGLRDLEEEVMSPPDVIAPPPRVRIGFSTPKKFNPFSWIIRRLTGSTVSHAWILYYSDRFKCEMVMDAHEWGNRLIRFEDFQKKNLIVKVITPAHPIEDGLPEAAKWLGSVYDFAGLVGMSVVLLGRWLKTKWNNPFRSSSNVYCSEWVLRAMMATEGYRNIPLDPETTEPEKLMRFLELEEATRNAAA